MWHFGEWGLQKSLTYIFLGIYKAIRTPRALYLLSQERPESAVNSHFWLTFRL